MVRLPTTKVSWDEYGIKNNPSEEVMEKELNRLEALQQENADKNHSIVNMSLVNRQNKINILKKELGK